MGGIQSVSSNLLSAFRVDQASAGHHNLAHLCEVFTLLHKNLSHHSIGFFNRAGVTGNRFLYSKGCQSKVQRFQFRITIGNLVCMVFQVINQFLCPVRCKT